MIEPHGKRADSWWGTIQSGPGNLIPATQVVISVVTRIGIELVPQVAGRVMGVKFYMTAAQDVPVAAMILDRTTGKYLRVYGFRSDVPAAALGWKNTWLRPALRVTVGQILDVWVTVSAFYWRTVAEVAAGPVTRFNIKCNGSMQSTGVVPPGAPTLNTNANGVDILFQAD